MFIFVDHYHEDGTRSDSEDPGPTQSLTVRSHHTDQSEESPAPAAPTDVRCAEVPDVSPPTGAGVLEPHSQHFIIEFFDQNPRKKRSHSFTHNPQHTDNYATLRAKLERRKGAERPASVHGNLPPHTQQVTVPLKTHTGHQRSNSLKRGEERRGGTSPPGSSTATVLPFGSVGRKSKLAQEFLDQSAPPLSAPPVMMSPSHAHLPSPDAAPLSLFVSHPSSPSQIHGHDLFQMLPSPVTLPCSQAPPPDPKSVSGSGRVLGPVRTEEEDSLSDAGTYTIETESQDKEVEEARSMIDQVRDTHTPPPPSGDKRQ